MSQHDYVIDNQSGAAFRADLNLVLAALVSQNAGATAPATTYAHMPWVDTSGGTPILKFRNAANSAWLTMGNMADYFGLIPAANGMVARTAAGTTTNRTITGTANVVTVTDGDGVAGNPTLTVGSLVARTDQTKTFTAAQIGEVEALTDGATITPDFALSNNYSVTLGGNRTLANPTNLVAGQSGVIFISQDGTGSRTLAYGTAWDFAGGTAPTLTTTASAVDVLVYTVRTTGSIAAQLIANIS